MSDPFRAQRFVDPQEPVYPRVLAELRRGKKKSHQDVVHLPPVCGPRHSSMAQRFAIGSREEAVAYLGHSVLRARLRECAALVNAVDGSRSEKSLAVPTTSNSVRP
jgi:uncharacterized protein (DUF1810 family)